MNNQIVMVSIKKNDDGANSSLFILRIKKGKNLDRRRPVMKKLHEHALPSSYYLTSENEKYRVFKQAYDGAY